LFGLILIVGNLGFPCHWNGDPMDATKLENALYYAISRPSWVFGVNLILLSIFTGHYSLARAFLSGNNLRIIAKSIAIACLLVVLAIQVCFCSNVLPDGMYLTFPVALIFGLGFIFVSCSISVFLLVFLEFPFRRILQLILLPYISHDKILEEWH
jgi:hypothetical protein